jgi:hypothetical protein
MHPYAIFDHQRQVVGRFLGITSFILGPIICSLFVKVSTIDFLSFLKSFVIPSGLIYIALDWIFDNLIWKVSFIGKALSIPNFSGCWLVNGQTINEEGQAKYEWKAKVVIVQKWDSISIQLKTEKSESYSYTASSFKLPDGKWQLSYSYGNQPSLEQLKELQAHRGFCELIFDLNTGVAEGTYFNSMGRRTNGNMSLVKQ